MRQLKTFMKNRKESILWCGDCSCYTLQCWRNSDVNCGCWGWVVQELEVMPVPDTPWMFSIHMPDNGNWVIIENGPLRIVNMDKTTDSVLFWFRILDQDPEEEGIWKHIVNEEVYNSITSTLENLPQEWGKLSANDSKAILDAYNDLVKTAIVLKNPRNEHLDSGAEYFLMDLYDYKTDTLIGTYEFDFYSLQSKNNIYLPEAILMNGDMGGYIYGLVNDEDYSSWAEDVSVDWEVVYLAYEYSKSFRNVLALTWLYVPIYLSDDGVGTNFYAITLEVNKQMSVHTPLYNHIFYTNDGGVESWEALANDATWEVLKVTKEQDNTFTFTIEWTWGDLDAVVAVLEWLRTETQWAIFYQCTESEYTWEEAARNVLWEVYVTPTQEKINEAITKMEQMYLNGEMITYCWR